MVYFGGGEKNGKKPRGENFFFSGEWKRVFSLFFFLKGFFFFQLKNGGDPIGYALGKSKKAWVSQGGRGGKGSPILPKKKFKLFFFLWGP